jgi:phosphoglucomutase
MFDGCRPTPVLSFAVRRLGCIAGVNVTASHNPKEYNGYKVYWADGAQLPPDHAAAVSASMDKIDIFDGVPSHEKADKSLISVLDSSVDDDYVRCVMAQMVNPEAVRDEAHELAIVYTPLHGAGGVLVPRVLREAGLTGLYTVEAQMKPNGDFPTLKYPNPEFPEAFTLGIEEAERRGSDLVIATDPDTDRVGAAARCKDGSFRLITGNQMGALLLDYIITEMRRKGEMPEEPYAVKTIVTTPLAAEICKAGGVKIYDVLTGFKFIGEVIKEHEKAGRGTFVLGFEESYGYLKGTYCRDKDAVVASLLICEMAAYYRKHSMTLIDALYGIYEKYGYFKENVFNIEMSGLSGHERMKSMMKALRDDPPSEIGGRSVVERRDYLPGDIIDVATGARSATGLPSSDVLYYVTDRGDKIVVRPSGTEPKVKIYVLSSGKSEAEASENASACEAGIRKMLK